MAEDETDFLEEDSSGKRKRGRPPGRRPLTEGNAEDTRRAILKHAAALFNQRGYAAVSIDDIAEAAGLTRATLYYHYRGKAELFVEMVSLTGAFVHLAIAHIASLEHLSVPERLRVLINAWREGPDLVGEFADALCGGPAPDTPHLDEHRMEEAIVFLTPRQQARVRASFDGAHRVIRALMSDGVARGELRPLPPEVLDYAFWHLFQPPHYPTGPDLSRKIVDEHLLTLLLNGISAG